MNMKNKFSFGIALLIIFGNIAPQIKALESNSHQNNSGYYILANNLNVELNLDKYGILLDKSTKVSKHKIPTSYLPQYYLLDDHTILDNDTILNVMPPYLIAYYVPTEQIYDPRGLYINADEVLNAYSLNPHTNDDELLIDPSSPMPNLPVTDIPVGDIPVGDIPVGDIPVGDIPVGDIPVGDIPVGDIPVGDIPVADIPVIYIPVVDIIEPSISYNSEPSISYNNKPSMSYNNEPSISYNSEPSVTNNNQSPTLNNCEPAMSDNNESSAISGHNIDIIILNNGLAKNGDFVSQADFEASLQTASISPTQPEIMPIGGFVPALFKITLGAIGDFIIEETIGNAVENIIIKFGSDIIDGASWLGKTIERWYYSKKY